jgi:hypothetical protein
LAGGAADAGGKNDPGDSGEHAGEGVERDGEGRDAAVADPGGGEGDQGEREEEGEVRPEDAVGDVVEIVDEVVVVDPVDAGLDEAEEVDGEQGEKAWRPLRLETSLPGTCSSSTMMVMMTAMTPSEKASRRPRDRGLGIRSSVRENITTQRDGAPIREASCMRRV